MIYLAYIAAAAWSLGCICLLIVGAKFLMDEDNWLVIAAAIGIVGPVGLVIIVLPWVIIADAQSPVLATLRKDEWVCTGSKLLNTTQLVSAGKTTLVVPTTRSECVNYARVAG